MEWNREKLFEAFEAQDLFRGRRYYSDDLVSPLFLQKDGAQVSVKAYVRGTRIYTVSLQVRSDRMRGSCTCARCAAGYYCKHMAAVLMKFLHENGESSKPQRRKTSEDASRMLRVYLQQEDLRGELPVQVQLVPLISFDEYGSYPSFRFRIGTEKMYLVKNIQALADSVLRQEFVSYGKELGFRHAIENFTPEAQTLLRILMDMFPQCRDDEYSNGWYGDHSGPLGRDKRRIRLDGSWFDRLFTELCGQQVERDDGYGSYLFCEENPELHVHLSAADQGAVVRFDAKEFMCFGNQFHLYVMNNWRLCRCTPDFTRSVRPFLKFMGNDLFFAQEDLPALSNLMQSFPVEYISVDDPEGILETYAPSVCTGCYYLDYEEGSGLSAIIKFRYGEQLVPEHAAPSAYQDIRRNEKQEHAICKVLEQDFVKDPRNDVYRIADEDTALNFLCEKLLQLQSRGEVYLSDRLQSKQISDRTRPELGISVSDGLLTLDLNTGSFPPEELEALYDSLLSRRHYHKLRDGRYLPLTGSGYEKLAEIAHMTQLKAGDLKAGHVELPAYRSLYLNCVLENSETVTIDKNAGFRQMIRDFRSVEDSDYAIPDTLHASLRPYQETGYRWMKTLEANGFGGILADEMGLGKTVQMLAFLLTVPRAKIGKPSIIVCPASLVINWADETQRFAPDLRTLVLLGNAKERHRQLEQDTDADLYITSYDLVKRDLALYEEKEFYCCVLDEGQNIKNQSTKVSKAVKKIRCTQRFVLTGTPIENRLSELWNLFDFLMPGYLFSHTAFVGKLEKPIVKSDSPDARRQLGLLVQPFLLRRQKQQVLRELPPKIFHVHRIPLSEEERKVYQAEAFHAATAAAQLQDRVQILALLTKLRQICCDPALCFENYAGESSKLDACLELCSSQVANGHQVLLFSQFTSMLDRIRQRLDQAGISSFTLVGATPKEKRAKLVRDFNAGKASVFLISLKAGGTGLNLTAADVVIHYDPWWNQAAQDQATDRAHRIGQQHTVQVYKLIASETLEEKILKLQERKAALLDAVTEQTETQPLTREEILDLLR